MNNRARAVDVCNATRLRGTQQEPTCKSPAPA
jgi:hypothetical protein